MDIVSISETLAEQGVTALVKADGERMLDRSRPWTFVASGEPLGGQVVRVDAVSVEACLAAAVPRMRALGASVPE
ncbi:hypothetical protein [Streptomyces werraensis]|uniref:hypothetical protein n=1 Tax=Streptomyces werraensis TaxID=68284 RepID=UPI0033B6CFDA